MKGRLMAKVRPPPQHRTLGISSRNLAPFAKLCKSLILLSGDITGFLTFNLPLIEISLIN